MSGEQEPPSPWRQISAGLLRRPGPAQLAVAVLCGALAFALVTQAHTTSTTNGVAAARPDDLLAILADLQGRADRLRAQVEDLQATERSLTAGSAGTSAALAAARERAATLGILTGTVAAHGPGIVLTVDDPRASVHADVLVDAIEELRDAGAEAMQLSGAGGTVRVVASTALVQAPGGVVADGTRLRPPYRLTAIGDPRTLASALGIPGGVTDNVASAAGASAHVATSAAVTVGALRRLTAPRYARPASAGG
jgi:uncharacterized protein YlxW (UPF0749 family)